MKPLYRPKEDVEKSFLYKKWGSTDAERMERTHLYILDVVKHRWDALTEDQRRYFLEKQGWEEKWSGRKESFLPYRG